MSQNTNEKTWKEIFEGFGSRLLTWFTTSTPSKIKLYIVGPLMTLALTSIFIDYNSETNNFTLKHGETQLNELIVVSVMALLVIYWDMRYFFAKLKLKPQELEHERQVMIIDFLTAKKEELTEEQISEIIRKI